MSDATDWHKRMQRLHEQINELEHSAPPEVQERMRQMVQTLLDLHGTGLARLVDRMVQAGEAGHAILQTCASDDLTGSLLLLHDLHPWDLDTRVRWAVNRLRPGLIADGVSASVISATEGVVRLRVEGGGTVAVRLQPLFDEAILAVAPEVERIELEAVDGPPSTLIPLPMVGGAP